ncbi:MAG: enoyl-CoA hydratase-related protein [Chloroflexota bacterium]
MNTIITEKKNGVVTITINRPKVLNALNSELMAEMIGVMQACDRDPDVGCFLITGNERAFAAGADIKELESKSYMDMFHEDFLGGWQAFANLRTPKIAAVSGYALGGGCELAMMCDVIYASETARFGQPEIKLGLIPGMGGSQRLTKLVGKAKAMDMILTGRMMKAEEAERAGLVARVFPVESFMENVTEAAELIASYGKTAVMVAKETVNQALEMGLQEGLLYERRNYHALWATHDAQEGMLAFLEKRDPVWNGR